MPNRVAGSLLLVSFALAASAVARADVGPAATPAAGVVSLTPMGPPTMPSMTPPVRPAAPDFVPLDPSRVVVTWAPPTAIPNTAPSLPDSRPDTPPPSVERALATTAASGRLGRGRVRGLFIGIDEYTSSSPLEGCARDAERAAAAFVDRGLAAREDLVVLTDRGATRVKVEAALAGLRARSRPEDVVVFFFSGHGRRTGGAQAAHEADGRDEAIVLHDGELVDDALDAALDSIASDTTLVVLDACHAGGFAHDLAAPNRIGLFSSEEDVLSDTAPRYGAGGFLSYFFANAIESLGRGTTMRVGDLTNTLSRRFHEHRNELTTEDDEGFATSQNLVVFRSVRLGQPLFRAGSNALARR